jgi:hypothetical protein
MNGGWSKNASGSAMFSKKKTSFQFQSLRALKNKTEMHLKCHEKLKN